MRIAICGTSRFGKGCRLTAAAIVGPLMLSGCHAPERQTAGFSVQERPIDSQAFGRGEDVVLIVATIHGSEAAGTPLVRRLARHLEAHPELLDGRQVVLMPVANPDGHVLSMRHNVNGVDLNRNFPAPNFVGSDRHGPAPLSEPESRAIKAVLDEYRPNRMVSIHQPLACIDYDGPAEGLAHAMGEWTDLPVKRLGSLPGSLGSYVGITLDVPIITLELPESASDLDEAALWDEYGQALLAAITYGD